MGMETKMTYVLIRHKVKDYDKWKSVFDENIDFRKAGGEIGGRLFQNMDDPNYHLQMGHR